MQSFHIFINKIDDQIMNNEVPNNKKERIGLFINYNFSPSRNMRLDLQEHRDEMEMPGRKPTSPANPRVGPVPASGGRLGMTENANNFPPFQTYWVKPYKETRFICLSTFMMSCWKVTASIIWYIN